jgi:hypothetical protein
MSSDISLDVVQIAAKLYDEDEESVGGNKDCTE